MIGMVMVIPTTLMEHATNNNTVASTKNVPVSPFTMLSRRLEAEREYCEMRDPVLDGAALQITDLS